MAERLSMSDKYDYRIIQRGLLPAIRMGSRSIRVHLDDLKAFIAEHRQEIVRLPKGARKHF
ncbi:MAG: excisionase family DNA-binding protein [Pirellulaceae bacterium]